MCSCYIIDDEIHALELLADYVSQTSGLTLSGSSTNPIEGLHHILSEPPTILFLDINMPNLSGLEIFKFVFNKSKVVFTTAHANYAVESYTLNVADFLLKPIRYERFKQCIQKLAKEISETSPQQEQSNFMFIQSGLKAKIIKITFDDILYIESLNNYLVIHLLNEKHMVYMSLRELMEQLPSTSFSRIHKSFIINDRQIKVIEGTRVFLNHMTSTLNIGTQYKEQFFQKIHRFLLRKVRL